MNCCWSWVWITSCQIQTGAPWMMPYMEQPMNTDGTMVKSSIRFINFIILYFFLLVPMYFTIYKTFIISHCQYFHKFTNDFVHKKSNKIFLRNPINMHQILNEHCLFYLHKWILCSSKMFILKVSEKNPINFFPCRVYQFS